MAEISMPMIIFKNFNVYANSNQINFDSINYIDVNIDDEEVKISLDYLYKYWIMKWNWVEFNYQI